MPLVALGLNHSTAPLSLREQVAIAPEATLGALRELASSPGIREAAILSTCNRTELYCHTEAAIENRDPGGWLHHFHQLEPGELEPYLYRHQDAEAVRHVLRVATGLDSLIVGEPQILGQMKSAYRQAREAATIAAPLERLFQHTFHVAKRVRSDTAIGASPVSVAFAAVKLAGQIHGDFKRTSVMVLGAGDTAELSARHFYEMGVRRMFIVNRSAAAAQTLAAQFNAVALSLSDLDAYLPEADVMLCSTASAAPIVSRESIERALKARKRRPMFIADIAVPRDVEASAGQLDDVFLYTVDDLGEVIAEGLRSRQEAAEEAETIINLEVDHFMGWLRSLDAQATISRYRQHGIEHAEHLLARAKRKLAAGQDPEQVLNEFAHRLTRRLLHEPTERLRSWGHSGKQELVDLAAELLLDIEPKDSSSEDKDP